MRYALTAVVLLLTGTETLFADQAAAFFEAAEVREIRLSFDDANWYNTLYQARTNSPDTYFPARFQYGDAVLDRIGVRFKGNSSFRRQGVKKSFKLDFNEFVEGAEFMGLKKLNLHNGDLQPDFVREKMFLDFAARYMPTMRAVHVRVYVNDAYYGLYIAVEQPDKTMMQSRFGDDEDGNLYEAGESGATLGYLGTDPASYQRIYSLKTNETENDYSGLIQFLNILNNTPTATLPEDLEPICDVQNMLYALAMNNLFVNLDSYIGSGSEYMLYQRQDNNQFVMILWDGNEAFGTTGDGSPSIADPPELDPFYQPSASTGGGGRGVPGGGMAGTGSRPLMQKLWAVDVYKRTYLRMLARMLREGFNPTAMEPRITELANLIRSDVYSDPNKFYSDSNFETALQTSVRAGQLTVQGVAQFVRERYNYLRPVLDGYAQPADVRLNEILTVNAAGDAWLEILNLGPGTVNLGGFYLTDDAGAPTKWALPSRSLADGEFLILAPDSIGLRAAGGKLLLYTSTGGTATLIDSVEHPALSSGRSYIRLGPWGSNWAQTNLPSPGEANPASGINTDLAPVTLVINELMADNKSTATDPEKTSAYDDWFEIYNPGTEPVDMSGMYLTDKLSNPTKWRIPEGVIVPAGGYLLFWADDEADLGPLHAGFKLSADGEEIGLFHIDGATQIDAVVFGKQEADVPYGRTVNGGGEWAALPAATPGAPN